MIRLAPILLALALTAGCRSTGETDAPATQEVPVDRPPIATVIADHASRLLALDGVVTVYEGALEDGSPCLKIGVAARPRELAEEIGDTLEGYPVVIVETGEIAPR